MFPYVALQVKVVSPKHRLIKVDSQEFGRCKIPLSPVTVQEEPVSIAYAFFPSPSSRSLPCISVSQTQKHAVIFPGLLFGTNKPIMLSNLTVNSPLCPLPPKVVPSAPAASDTDTDYSDPFDARPDPRARPNWEPKPAPTDCCSYMEPFEAQRIISGRLDLF